MVNWNKDYQIHTILFNKHKNKPEDAIKWLLDNDYKVRKIHETTNEYRFRQISPETLKKHGFNQYRTKMIDPTREIQLVVAYKDPVKGSIKRDLKK